VVIGEVCAGILEQWVTLKMCCKYVSQCRIQVIGDFCSPFSCVTGLQHHTMGGDEGQEQESTCSKTVDLIFGRSLNVWANPPTRAGGMGKARVG
jgi:hypothetical protein